MLNGVSLPRSSSWAGLRPVRRLPGLVTPGVRRHHRRGRRGRRRLLQLPGLRGGRRQQEPQQREVAAGEAAEGIRGRRTQRRQQQPGRGWAGVAVFFIRGRWRPRQRRWLEGEGEGRAGCEGRGHGRQGAPAADVSGGRVGQAGRSTKEVGLFVFSQFVVWTHACVTSQGDLTLTLCVYFLLVGEE